MHHLTHTSYYGKYIVYVDCKSGSTVKKMVKSNSDSYRIHISKDVPEVSKYKDSKERRNQSILVNLWNDLNYSKSNTISNVF